MAHNAADNADNTYDLSGEDGDQALAAVMDVYRKQNQRPSVSSESSGKKPPNPLAILGMPTSAQVQDYYNPNGKRLIYPRVCILGLLNANTKFNLFNVLIYIMTRKTEC